MWLWGSRQISETCASRQKDCRAGPLKVSTCRESIGAWSYFTVWHKSAIIEVLRIKSIWDFQLFLCFSGIRPKSPPAQHTSCRLCPLAVTWSSRRKQPIRKILDQLWEKLIKISQAPSSPTVINCEIHTCALAICFHQSNSIRSPYPPLQIQMIYGRHYTSLEGVVFLTAAVQTSVVHATGSFDITENMKTWNIVIDHWAYTNQIVLGFVWS